MEKPNTMEKNGCRWVGYVGVGGGLRRGRGVRVYVYMCDKPDILQFYTFILTTATWN